MTLLNRLSLTMGAVLGMLIGSTDGEAQSIKSARAHYAAGEFESAANVAKAQDTFEGYLLASKALTIEGHYFSTGDNRQQTLREAMELARIAVELQPNNSDAHLHLALAMGRYSQSISAAKALSEGYAEAIKETFDTLLRLDPNSWNAHLGLGSWHAEIVVKGGFLGRLAFGASKKKAFSHFVEAKKLAPDSAIFHLEFARGLRTLDFEKYRDNVGYHLRRAAELPVKDAYDRIIRKEALDLLADL